MSDIKLIIDGKEYICRPVEDTDAAAETTAESERPRTGYERVGNGGMYFYVNTNGDYIGRGENTDTTDNKLHDKGNYYNDEQLAADIARADTLMRRLRQWQALNDDVACGQNMWFVKYEDGKIDIDNFGDSSKMLGMIYFSSAKKVREAIDVFHDELMWYFTEYRQRLDEPERSE